MIGHGWRLLSFAETGPLIGPESRHPTPKVQQPTGHPPFLQLQHIRPGDWTFAVGTSIDQFAQYRHLAEVRDLVASHKALRTALGDYIVIPDIVVSRLPVDDAIINARVRLVEDRHLAGHTPLRTINSTSPILHASVSCKWTIRSDRSQNARTEGLNLARNRKGAAPHVAVVTAEPLPSRIATLALGTGDIDCVYHFALPELQAAVRGKDHDLEALSTLVDHCCPTNFVVWRVEVERFLVPAVLVGAVTGH